MSNRHNGTITLEIAKKKFNDYYDKRNKTNAGKIRGKLFDAMYQKKPSKTLKPNTPGSEKYLLEEGPRTFDMEGVDSFPEGEKFNVVSGNKSISGTSKGASKFLAGTDQDISKVYGPRLKNI